MRTSDYGEVIVNSQDVFDALYKGQTVNLEECLFDNLVDIEQFNNAVALNADHIPTLKLFQPNSIDQNTFDQTNQDSWFMPDQYKHYDIIDWLYCKCSTTEQKNRVTQELELFVQHNMFDLLKYVKYLVDTMREHKIVWGVGRGSSVASYVLYLIGIHKVDSIKYELDIHEFLKEKENV